jgi:hypothetical protein
MKTFFGGATPCLDSLICPIFLRATNYLSAKPARPAELMLRRKTSCIHSADSRDRSFYCVRSGALIQEKFESGSNLNVFPKE